MKSLSFARPGAAALLLCLVAQVAGAAEPGRVRVYASAQQKVIPFDELVASLAAEADVVFVGEQHDDPATHRVELALLTALHAKRPRAALSLEMFERDTQTALDAYLAGAMTEEVFLGHSRPWKNYSTDYRPLVEFARTNRLPVIAANVPRRLSSKVATGKGLAELAALPTGDAQWVAAEVYAPRDRYWLRFRETMRGHAGTDEGAMYSYYTAQVVKDETMAESIARFWTRAAADRPIVVHYNGAFHSDFGEGTALRVRRRAPAAATAIVTIIPVDDPEKADGAAESGRADYVVFCAREPKPAAGA
jgi:uncharacterized iron-regulated protein